MKLHRKVLNLYLVEENLTTSKAVVQMCSVKKAFLEILQNSQENTSSRFYFLIKKEILTEMFSCEFCKISKNTFFHRVPLVVASEPFMTQTRCVCRVVEHSSMCILRYFKDTMCWIDAWDYIANIWMKSCVYDEN